MWKLGVLCFGTKGTVCFYVPKGVPAPEMSVNCGGVLFDFPPKTNKQLFRRIIMISDNLLTPKAYRKTIEKYLPFVLIRCSKYTNSRRLAEIIALYVFICSYQLARILDGINTMEIIIDNMVGVIGEDLTSPSTPLRTGKPGIPVNGQLLFKWDDDLGYARRLAEMDMEDCFNELQRNSDFTARCLDFNQFERITESVIENLIKINQPNAVRRPSREETKRQHFSAERRLR